MKNYFYNLDIQKELAELKKDLPDNVQLIDKISKIEKMVGIQQEQLITKDDIIVWSYDLKNSESKIHCSGNLHSLLNDTNAEEKFIECINIEDRQRFKKHLKIIRTGGFSEVYYRFINGNDHDSETCRHSLVEKIINNRSYVVDREMKNDDLIKRVKLENNSSLLPKEKKTFPYQKLFESIPIPIVYKDKNRYCIGCNEEMRKIFGLYNIDEYIGLRTDEYGQNFETEVFKTFIEEEQRLQDSGGSVTVDVCLVDKNGIPRHFIVTSVLVELNNDVMFISTAIELTKMLEYKNDYETLNNQFYKIMNIMGEALIYYDANLDVILANRAAQKLYHSSLDGKNLRDIIDHDAVAETIIAELRNRQNSSTIMLSKKKGKEYFEITYYPLYHNHQLGGLVMLIKDITNRVNADRKSFLQQQQLLQADKLSTLGTLVSGVAHEINNPANFISINSSILRKIIVELEPIFDFYYQKKGEFTVANFHSSTIMKTLNMIATGLTEGVDRIDNIVNTLKEYSRDHVIDSHKSININRAIEKGITILRGEINKSTRNLVVDLQDDLPQIDGDILKLEQVLINIIQNACQSLTSMNSLIRIKSYFDIDSDHVVVVVEDEGVGIKKEYLQKIKDPFFTTKRDSGGTGLGLSICVAIVQEHNGLIEIKSSENVGTIIRLSFPIDH